jgi:hypothetical protein
MVPPDMGTRIFKRMFTTYVKPDKPFFVVLDDKDTFWLLNR